MIFKRQNQVTSRIYFQKRLRRFPVDKRPNVWEQQLTTDLIKLFKSDLGQVFFPAVLDGIFSTLIMPSQLQPDIHNDCYLYNLQDNHPKAIQSQCVINTSQHIEFQCIHFKINQPYFQANRLLSYYITINFYGSFSGRFLLVVLYTRSIKESFQQLQN